MKSNIVVFVLIVMLAFAGCNAAEEIAPLPQPEIEQEAVSTSTQENGATQEDAELPEQEEQIKPVGEILFSSERGGDRDLYMMNADGSNLRIVLDLPSIEGHGDFAPDGYRIAFFSDMDGDREIYTIDLRDEQIVPNRLTNAKGKDHLPDFSPDGKSIVFASERDGGQSEIYIIDADGKNQRRLTDNSTKDMQPKFSPDGKKISYTARISGVEYVAFIDVEDIEKSDEIPQSTVLDIKNVGYADWSPDSKYIAYHSRAGGKVKLMYMDVETQEVFEMSQSDSYTLWVPVYSPDGKWITYNKERGFGTGDVYVRRVDGGEEHRLTLNPKSDWGPDWRPERNKSILYDSNKDGDREICLYSTADESITKLTDNEDDDGIPYWSPDGKRIVFFSDRDGDDEIYTMDADGTNVIQLTDNDAEDRAAVWSNDGKFIVFSSDRDGDREIFIMLADGTKQTQLTNNDDKDFWPAISKDDNTVTYTHFADTQDTYTIDIKDWQNREGFSSTLLSENCSRCEYSPDGTRLAYSTQVKRSWMIAVSNADGSDERIATTNMSDEWVPTWVNDYQLVFSRETGYRASIIMLDLNTGEEKMLVIANAQNWRPVSYCE